MTPAVKWVEMDPDDPMLRPIYGPPCGAFNDHIWKLSVYEGRVSLDSGCIECNDVVMSPVGGEDVTMEFQIQGSIKGHLETFHTYSGTEYDHWWEFVPNWTTPFDYTKREDANWFAPMAHIINPHA